MTLKRLGPATAAAVFLALAVPAGAQAQAPANDNYLQSIPLNRPGDALLPDPLRDTPDTTNATEQPDIFSPAADGTPGGGGPPEILDCPLANGVSTYVKTVWYDVYPPVPGVLHVAAVGAFDPVVSAIPFNIQNAVPNYAARQCADRDSGPTEELFANLRANQPYTVQVGGYNQPPATSFGGASQITFEFFPDRDGDGVLDASDRCPTRPGDVNGCPRRLDRTVRAPFRWNARPGGVLLRFLKLDAPRGARISVSCTRGACRRFSRRATTITRAIGPVGFATPVRAKGAGRSAGRSAAPRAYAARTVRLFTNKRLRAGQRIDVRVTMPTAVGALIRHTVGNGTFKQTRFCMNPGSTRPRTRCR